MTLLLGAHMSIAGGVSKAVERAAAYDMTALQIFTRTARGWEAPPLTDEEADRFAARLAASTVRAVVAHASYLLNPASPDAALRRKSERGLADELTRCERLGVPWLILHPGSHRGTGAAEGARRAGRSLRRVLDDTAGYRAGILVENCAGQGDTIGDTFREVGEILGHAGDGDRLGACLDTCHAFATGYDLRDDAGWARARRELSREVGLRRVRAVHVNDSKRPLGSRVDRHEGIGLGEMGLAPFRRLLADPTLARRPLILETPKSDRDGEDLDARNLRVLRGFSAANAGPGK